MKYPFTPLLVSLVVVGCMPSDNLEVIALNQRISELEHSIETYQNIVTNTVAASQTCQNTTQQSHASYPEVNIEVNPDLLDWYYAQPLPEYGQRSFIRIEGLEDAYSKKMLENPKDFIELIALINYENMYANMALSDALPPEYYPLLIPHLKTSYAIASLAYEKRLHKQYETEFVEAFHYWNDIDNRFIPSSLVVAIIELDKPELTDAVRNYAIHGFGRQEIFKQLEIYQPYNLDKLALTAWDNLRYDEGIYNIIEVAYVAAKYAGSRDALYELAIQFKISEDEDREILQEELTEIISLPSFENFDENVAKLEFKPSMKKWYMPS
jgi:hypothetical protein